MELTSCHEKPRQTARDDKPKVFFVTLSPMTLWRAVSRHTTRKSIGCFAGDMPQAKGIVTGLVPLRGATTLAEIEWDRAEMPHRVNVKNLCRVNTVAFYD